MLSLSHIDFAYEKGPLLLQDLCMEVHDGDYVAVGLLAIKNVGANQ